MPKIVPYDEKKINLPCSLVYESQAAAIKEIAGENTCSQSKIVQEAMNEYIEEHRSEQE